MLYLACALAMYVHGVYSLRLSPPEGARETLSVILLCTATAALWPVVLLWALPTRRSMA